MERMKPTESVAEVLTDDQKRAMQRVLEQEEARREHVVVYLSGAHAYGFPSPDSDLDLKAIHVARTEDLLGFEVPAPTVDRAEILDGVEIDYTSNELAHALAGILAGNGNFLERVLGRMVPHASPVLEELRPIVRRSLSRRVHRHYRGFAQNQLRFLEREPTAKKLLYVLRTTLTGIHLLRTGELEADLTRIMARYGFTDAMALVERKRAGERVALDPAQVEAWRPRVESLFAALDAARDASVLPEEPPNEEEVRAWLMTVRRARFA
jgi:predicted nucleotidyltransferase